MRHPRAVQVQAPLIARRNRAVSPAHRSLVVVVTTDLARVDHHRSVLVTHWTNQAFLLQVADGLARNGAVDLEPLADHCRGNELSLWDLLHHLVVRCLVEGYHVGELLLDLPLAPLLLTTAAARHGGLHRRGRANITQPLALHTEAQWLGP